MRSFITYLKFNPFLVGLGLLAVPVCSLFLSSLLFVCGFSINPFVFPLSVVLALVLMRLFFEKNPKKLIAAACWLLLIIAGSILVSAFFYDYSYDGQAYHQEAVFYMKNGWNPMYEHHESEAVCSIWISHYTKGLETVSATIYSTFGNIEVGKAVNFMLIFSAFFLFFAFLKTCFETISRIKIFLLTFLFTFSPVVITQILTYYIDWAAYALALILITALILCFKKPSKPYFLIIGFVIFFAGTVKFNTFFWMLFIMLCYLIYAVVLKKYTVMKTLILTCAVSGILSVFFAGFNPYVTNTMDHQHPFYPLAGKGKMDIMTGLTPRRILNTSRFESVMISLLSFPNTPYSKEETQFAFPQYLKTFHFKQHAREDTQIGGFGVCFAWIFVLSVSLYIMLFFRKNEDQKDKKILKYSIFLGILFMSLFILPYAWWARYFPFFYAFPLIIILYTECNNQNRSIVILRNLLYALLFLNSALFGTAVLLRSHMHKKTVVNVTNLLSKSSEPPLINFVQNAGFRFKLKEKHVCYQETTEQLGIIFRSMGPSVLLDSAKYAEKDEHLIEKKP